MALASAARLLGPKAAVALLLTYAAGCTDIVAFITIYQVFTSHMTGNTVHLAQHSVAADWLALRPYGCAIASFLIGSVAGRTLIEIGWRRRMRRIVSLTLLLEAVLIAVVALIANRDPAPHRPVLLLVALLAAAMGLQTATLTRIGSLTVHTTFVTGMLNKLAQLVSHALFFSYDIARGRALRAERRTTLCQAGFIGSIWLLYFGGAATGAWLSTLWAARALLLPSALVLAAVLLDQLAPFSLAEEHEQSER